MIERVNPLNLQFGISAIQVDRAFTAINLNCRFSRKEN